MIAFCLSLTPQFLPWANNWKGLNQLIWWSRATHFQNWLSRNFSLDQWGAITKTCSLTQSGGLCETSCHCKQMLCGKPRVHYHITSLKHSCPGGIKPVQGRFGFSHKEELNILRHISPVMNHESWQLIGGCCEVNGSRETQHYRLSLSLARYKLWTVESRRRSLGFRPF